MRPSFLQLRATNLSLLHIIAPVLILISLLLSMNVFAEGDFVTKEQEKRYKSAANSLRCVVCQNQSIADSNAPEAQVMRAELKEMVLDGLSEAAIGRKFVEKYGQRVTYTPPMAYTTIPLWGLPFGMVLFLAIFIYRRGRRPE